MSIANFLISHESTELLTIREISLTLYQLVSSADNLCKLFRRPQNFEPDMDYGTKQFDTLMVHVHVFLEEFLKKLI